MRPGGLRIERGALAGPPSPREAVGVESTESAVTLPDLNATRPGTVTGWSSDGRFDRAMRRLLRIPEQRKRPDARSVYRTFSTSMTISALRCLLTYVLLPVVTPALGLATGVGPALGIPIALLALYFDVLGIRRFWLADHRSRVQMTFVYLAVMAMVASLLGLDLAHLAS
jgi:hypothetical protein